jgi:PTH1 family peptidyl-tRNA hydrolase
MPSSQIRLIVGLANPGKEYESTRHNAGAWFIHGLAQQAKIQMRFETKHHGWHGIITPPCHLLIPNTYMNHSGQAVSACLNYFKLAPESILIAHDDIDLPAGTIKLKFDGGDGGHNGLKDIIRHLNTKKFHRLRIGVGRPTHDTIDYVLNPPSKADRQKIDDALTRAFAILPFLLEGQISHAMQNLHTIGDM